MVTNKMITVTYENDKVGTLAMTEYKMVAFEYSDVWLRNGFSISPFSLPLEKRVFIPTKSYFDGLFGVFADSLPDAWGNILLSRLLRKQGINPDEVSILDRLAIVGASGMGALSYYPEISISNPGYELDLDKLADWCNKILTTEYSDNLDQLFELGGTSGGARPKIMTEIGRDDWIIKFQSHVDSMDIGRMEYDYSLCAKECGINMTETRLFPSGRCAGYFGIKRFDRKTDEKGNKKRIHMCTVAALLETDFNQPSLDYYELMKLVKILTKDNVSNVDDMYRRMCFNVFAHNRDDHAKNFTYIYDDSRDRWSLSPAYDLTYSSTYYGEHTTSVNGNGKNPTELDLLSVGRKAGLGKHRCEEIIKEVDTSVKNHLQRYLDIKIPTFNR